MSMHTPQEWAQHATVNMTQAQQAHYSATKQMHLSRRAHDDTVVNNINMYDMVTQAMAQKVKNSHRLIEKLTNRQQSLENSLQATQTSLANLERAHQEKEAPIQLCKWRLEQREKRPLREQVRDVVEVSLEEEKAALMETQRRLGEAIKRSKAAIHDLQESLAEVKHDLEQKLQALSVDETCLRSAERSMHAVIERTPPPSSARGTRPPNSMKMARHQVAIQESSSNEIKRQQMAERLSRHCASREEAAKALREENAKLVNRCEMVAMDAAAKSEKRMQERIQENQAMRRRLEGEIRETHAQIQHTKGTITETRYQLKALEEPIDLTAACSSWRKQRATKEQIVDPVTTTLTQHRMTVLAHHQDLLGHHQMERTNLKELQDRRERLKEDLKDKTHALHIDLNCLTHEAIGPSYVRRQRRTRSAGR